MPRWLLRYRQRQKLNAARNADQNMHKALQIALQEYGKTEVVGPGHNGDIVNYFAKSGNSWVKDDETAWCAAFVGYCLETAGYGSTKKLNARSYLSYGRATTAPKLGDIVVFWRGTPNGWEGHVAFYISEIGDDVHVLGGNQSNQVNISAYPKSKVLGYRTGFAKDAPAESMSNEQLLAVIKNLIILLRERLA